MSHEANDRACLRTRGRTRLGALHGALAALDGLWHDVVVVERLLP